MDWYRILEEGDLANIKYHTVGEPEIVIAKPMNLQQTGLKIEKEKHAPEEKQKIHKAKAKPAQTKKKII